MDFNAAVDLILKDLYEARDIIDDLKNYPGVPVIQVELAKSKCKSAAEVIALLKTVKPEESRPLPEEKQSPHVQKKAEQGTLPASAPAPATVTAAATAPPPQPETAGSVIFADTFARAERLNEQMKSRREDDHVSDMMKSKPLTNLADAIGVNDKFLFIREIFNGSPDSFNQAISKLETASNYSEAKEVLKGYTGESKESDVVKQLLDLVKRKFRGNE